MDACRAEEGGVCARVSVKMRLNDGTRPKRKEGEPCRLDSPKASEGKTKELYEVINGVVEE